MSRGVKDDLEGESATESKEVIYGRQNIDKFIQILLEKQKKEETEIYLLCQPEYEYPYQILSLYSDTLNLKISHIICLQGGQSYEQKNTIWIVCSKCSL